MVEIQAAQGGVKRRGFTMRKGTKPSSLDELADFVLDGVSDRQVVVGPMLWQPNDRGGRDWYCSISASEDGRGWRSDMIYIRNELDRYSIIAAFVKRRPLLIHDIDD